MDIENKKGKKTGTSFFRSYFKSYEFREIEGKDGIVRNEFVYTGILYLLDAPKGTRAKLRIIHTLMLLATVTCFIYGTTQITIANMIRLSVLPQLLITVMIVLRSFTLVFYWFSPEEMTEWDYKMTVRHMLVYSLISAISSMIMIVISVILMLWYKDYSAQMIISIGMQVLCMLTTAVSWLIEKKSKYVTKASSTRTTL